MKDQAVGLAIGHYLATRRPALVYMQNSGLGNTVNPVASLADPLVYGIPMLLDGRMARGNATRMAKQLA